MWYFVKLFIACAIFVWLLQGGQFSGNKVYIDSCPSGDFRACILGND